AADVATGPAPAGQVQDALALLPADMGAARRMLSYLQRSGLRPLRVWPAGMPGSAEPKVDFADRDAVRGLVADLARRGKLPGTVVHGLMFGPDSAGSGGETAGTASLIWLLQAMQRYRGEAGLDTVRLVVLTSEGADVTGAEPVVPGRAMVAGLLRTAELEIESLRCELLDVGARSTTSTVVGAMAGQRLPQAAVRGADVWIPAVRTVGARSSSQQTLTSRGVYLITGGLGALGRFSARALADTGLNPRIALLGRSAEDQDDPTIADLVADLEMSGAEVELVAADVADDAQLEAAIKRIRERFGPVDGVLHAAGISGDGMLELRTAEQVDAVLRAKVDGGRLLHRLLGHEPNLRLVVHFGSRAALTGLVGSGDYAAANSYLNALACRESADDRTVVSVNWPGWAEAGMAVRGAAAAETGALVVTSTWSGAEWFLDEHRVAGTPVLPGTGYLDLIVTSATRQGLVPPGRPIVVADLVFAKPLAVARDTEVAVGFTVEGTSFQVAVRSRGSAGDEWTEHARAVLRSSDAQPLDIDGPGFVERLRGGRQVAVDTHGAAVRFGARWRNVEHVAKVDDELLAALALSAEHHADLADSFAHPALVDIATSIAQESAERPYLPFHYREVTLFRPVPAEVYAVNRVTTTAPDVLVADVTLYDRTGREVARITGFTMRPVDVGEFERAVTAPPTPRVGSLMSPQEGAELLLQVVRSAMPPVVVALRPDESLPGYVFLDDPILPAAPVAEREPAPAGGTALPRTPAPSDTSTEMSVEDQIRLLWQRLLGVVDVAADADFFDVGGTSMAAVQLVSRIRDEFDVQLGVGTIFEMGTVNRLAAEVRRISGKP
ncbi:SDR family NAD(P)-dependent oxidoreductase, partial [Actinophytocola sp.]|uniref:SDR family NAD(P)-dependent oxidoreductase n=1 Tax=Actinophytocola sp. TaxID=1872138 RepID=UPI003899C7DC